MFSSNQSLFSMQNPWVLGCPHHWKWSSHLWIWRCYLNPWSHSKKEFNNLHMDMGMGIVPCCNKHSCMHNGLSGISSVVQWLSSNETVWKSSSSSSSSRCVGALRSCLEGSSWGSCVWFHICDAPKGEGTSSSIVLSSSKELYVQSSVYRSKSWISGAAWCNWNWVKRGIFNAGNVVDPGCFLERSWYVEIFWTAFIAFVFWC